MSRTPSTKPRRTAMSIYESLPAGKRASVDPQVQRLLMLLDRMPADGYGVRILPCAYAERVLLLDGFIVRQLVTMAEHLGCLTAIFIMLAESIGEPTECYIVAADGRQPDVFWRSAPVIRDLRAARERCFDPSTPTPEVSAA